MKTQSGKDQPLPVRAFNRAARSIGAFGINVEADLSEEALLAAAKKRTGLVDFGDESAFRPGLQRMLRSIEEEAQLNPFGRLYARQRAVGHLANRLWAQDCFKKHPEILKRPIKAPLIIVGPPRTGTTRLQRVIAADEKHFLHMKAWEGINPAPRLNRGGKGWDARYNEANRLFKAAKLNPGAIAAHPTAPDLAEEEVLLMKNCFTLPFSLMAFHYTPSFLEWAYRCDKLATYEHTANLLRLISWGRGDDPKASRRWVLKAPLHMIGLPALMKVFPDAKLLFTHREPEHQAVASTISLMWHWGIMHTDQPLREPAAQSGMEYFKQVTCQCAKERPKIPANQQMDVDFEAMNHDPAAVLQSIYEFAGVEYTLKAKQAHQHWLAASTKKGHHGRHRYSLEDFGLTPEDVQAYISCKNTRK